MREPDGEYQDRPHGGAVHQGAEADPGHGGHIRAGRLVPVHQEFDGAGAEKEGGAGTHVTGGEG